MTAPKINLTELLADREAGTGGEWVADEGSVIVAGSGGGVGYPPKSGTVASLYDGEYIENPNSYTDARRIARLPALEAAYIEAVGLIIDLLDDCGQSIFNGGAAERARAFLGDGE